MRIAACLLALLPCLSTAALAEMTPCPLQVSYANGQTLRDGSSYFYPNGQPVLSGYQELYYPSGSVLKSGTNTYYPDGHVLQQGFDHDELYYPNGVVMRHWNGDSYDFFYSDGKPFVSGEKIFGQDGKPAPDGKFVAPIQSYGEIDASGSQGFVSTDVYLGGLLPGSKTDGGVVIPAGQEPPAPNDLKAIVQWPDMNYRPYYIILIPTGNGAERVEIDQSGGSTYCNVGTW